ncbi:hypothetical protein MAR_020090 [Mya arenaria]|uniref:Uncharacterized protein n=1 Tax=Mya arenaria TaxID=6604 RepID=A0ABY7EC51_MYAAR|nr:hypothetical protein MAR_020090 [Mya arenaria]
MDKSSQTTSTPIAPVGNKRDLSLTPSDEYLAAESKKARPDDPIELSSITERHPDTACVTNVQLSKDDVTAISLQLKSLFTVEIQSSINNAVDALIPKVIEGINLRLSDEIESLKTENAHLKARISVLEISEDRLEHLEQYSRRNSLRISGVHELEGESTDDIVTKLVSDLGSTESLDEIDRSHRAVHGAMTRPSLVISLQKLYSVRSQAKHCPNLKKVFVNGDLCKARSDVFYLARSLVRKGNINSAWTSDGVILIRDNDMHLHRVTKARELDNFQSVTVPRTSPTSQRLSRLAEIDSAKKLNNR